MPAVSIANLAAGMFLILPAESYLLNKLLINNLALNKIIMGYYLNNYGKILILAFIILTIILFSLKGYRMKNHSYDLFKESEFHGIINDIKLREGSRGLPHILIDNQWIFIGLNVQKIQHHIIVGDSIVKEPGSMIIKVYRKNSNGAWDERIYK